MNAVASTIARRALLTGILAGAGGAIAASAAKAADPLEDLLRRIADARARVRSVQGPFVQVRTIGLLAADVRSTGTFWLVRPDRLRWQLDPPDDVTFWITPEGLAYRDPHGQARLPAATARWAAALDDLRTLLGGDVTRLRDRWDLRVRKDDATGAELEASPRTDASSTLRNMRFSLAPDLVRPTRATLTEGPRDRTVIDFGALLVDAPIDESLLRPPPR
jgi:hypothetical protein